MCAVTCLAWAIGFLEQADLPCALAFGPNLELAVELRYLVLDLLASLELLPVGGAAVVSFVVLN